MRYSIVYEPQFDRDYKRLKQEHPELIQEVKNVIVQLGMNGVVEDSYNPHLLSHRSGLYTGNLECHVVDGKVDILVIYKPHKTNPQIRMIRVGSHAELFA